MTSSKKSSTSISFVEVTDFIVRALISAYCILLFILLPLCYRDKYYDIGDFKYELFLKLTLGLFYILIPVFLFCIAAHISHKTWCELTLRKIASSLTLTDGFVLLYLAACIISFLLSPYRTNWFHGTDTTANPAWFGYGGWFMGLKSQLMFIAIYFLVSRLFIKSWKFDLLASILGASAIVFLLGIFHRFLIDPLALYNGIDASYYPLFLSTIGQASWFSSYLCTIFPIGIFLFWYCHKRWQRIVLGIYTAIGFASLVTQNSDSAYFAMIAFLSILFILSLRSTTSFLRFLEVLMIAGFSMRFIGILQILCPQRAIQVDTISVFFSQNFLLWIFLFFIVALYFGINYMQLHKQIHIESIKWLLPVFYIVTAAIIPIGVLCIILTTTNQLPSFLSSFKNFGYFNFNDDWGNGRGFTWKYCVQMYSEYSIPQKLFGIGSDCFASYTYAYHSADVSVKWGNSVLANSHNEWMNMLLTTGLFGFVTYLGIFVSSFLTYMKNKKNNIYLFAAAACIISYFSHNIFCYQQVVCTPFIFLIIALAEFTKRNDT